MNNEHRTNRAFTLIELLVTIAILAMMISFTSVIFSVSIETHRVAEANAEIMQKLRAITNQLDSDFKSLRKDGEIVVIWQADNRRDPAEGGDPNVYERLDKIIFFANGDFHSYNPVGGNIIRGNVARISYMLARTSYDPFLGRPLLQQPHERILARTQHILTADPGLPQVDPASDWHRWRDELEYDNITMQQWRQLGPQLKRDILSILTGVIVDSDILDTWIGGTTIEPNNPNSYHLLMCEGVGQFQVQGWNDDRGQWLPSIDPDGNGDWSDTNFLLDDPCSVIGLAYNSEGFRELLMWNGISGGVYDRYLIASSYLVEENFNSIPGLGRAFKFTFTLYDSRGVFENGRTFSHIVYLDE